MSLDDGRAPSVAYSSRKRKADELTASTMQMSMIQNLLQMTEAISGLVGAARMGIQQTTIQTLYARRRQLEDDIKELEDKCLDTELKLIDADERRQHLYEKSLARQQVELDAKKSHLESINEVINERERSDGGRQQAELLPCFIDVGDGTTKTPARGTSGSVLSDS